MGTMMVVVVSPYGQFDAGLMQCAEQRVIHAVESDPPKGRKRIEWKLLTDLEVAGCDEAVEK